MNHKKTIIICMPYSNGISTAIILVLQNAGFEVYDFIFSDATINYNNIFQKINNFYHKTFLNDKKFKNELKKQNRARGFYEKLETISFTDYALFIRPDLIPLKLIKRIKLKTAKTIAYQWDGLNRFPEIFEYINYFDNFFSFDPKDVDINNGILPVTNFFISTNKIAIKKQSSMFFIGMYDEYRFNILEKLKKTINKIDKNPFFYFIPNNEKEMQILKNANYSLIAKIDYSENLKLVQKSKVLIDIVSSAHSGLSFRIFEALGYEIKLITNNSEIKKYDFYNPNNIFIWDEYIAENDLLKFLEEPFQPIDPKIKYKYSFHNWIKYILEDGEFIPIKLPA